MIYKDYFIFSTFILLFFRNKKVIIRKDILEPIGVRYKWVYGKKEIKV